MSIEIDKLVQIAGWLAEADGLLITAGAGMGVDSGLPDFRGTQGFWNAYPALARRQMDFHDIANGVEFARHPELSWGFYGHRLQLYRETIPHAGFGMLLELASCMPNGYFVFTSNVDGQFQKAGFSDTRIVECHGSIHYLQCAQSCCEDVWLAEDFQPVVDEENGVLTSPIPRCPHCKGLARPNILMFNDWNWLSGRSDLQKCHLKHWHEGVQRLMVIELGAGVSIPTVRRFGEKQQAPLVRINPTDADVAGVLQVGMETGALAGIRAITEYCRAAS